MAMLTITMSATVLHDSTYAAHLVVLQNIVVEQTCVCLGPWA